MRQREGRRDLDVRERARQAGGVAAESSATASSCPSSSGRRARRTTHQQLAAFGSDTGVGGRLRLLPFTADLLPRARRLLLERQPPTLDAFHVAAALTSGRRAAAPEELLFASHDSRQRAAAAAAARWRLA